MNRYECLWEIYADLSEGGEECAQSNCNKIMRTVVDLSEVIVVCGEPVSRNRRPESNVKLSIDECACVRVHVRGASRAEVVGTYENRHELPAVY